jgi:succinate-semialdehyde dehydrogenase/glutarate-semialdehyde dehydrogenase
MLLESINPATGESIRSYPEHTDEKVEVILREVQSAFHLWRSTPMEIRATALKKTGRLLLEEKNSLARLMALEMGKPITQGKAEIEKCTALCDYYAREAPGFLATTPVQTEAATSYITFEPLGILLAIMPWNFPFWQVLRAAAPAMMAGNGVVLKHASNVSGCSLAIETILSQAGFPPGLFRSLLLRSSRVGRIIGHPLISAVTLTGSTPAGMAVASQAGGVLKKTVLELGGSDPYLVFEDADLELAAEKCATSRLINAGQSCIAAKRFIVIESIREEFERLLVDRMRAQVMGDPLQENVTIGPLARLDLRDDLHAQVTKSIDLGAKCLLGGAIPAGSGAFYPPTVLSNVHKGMPVYDEETFGPVAAIVGVNDESEAIQVANDSLFGLGAAIFTRDLARGESLACRKLEAGSCFVNDFVRSDPRLPFGGIKQSGYGRELSVFGLHEFVNVKTISMK